jgi:6-phosphogluconolactonase
MSMTFTGITSCALITAAGAAQAASYVYVSNAEDGNIGIYRMASDGTLKPGDRVEGASW